MRQLCSSDDENKILAANVDVRSGQNRGKGGYSTGNSNKNASKVCTHCRSNGRTNETCYKKHGFPPHGYQYVTIRTVPIPIR